MKVSPVFKIFLLITFLGRVSQQTASAHNTYPVSTIPETLKTNAYAVIRLSETTFTVKSPKEAVKRVHSVISILNEKGKRQAVLGIHYDKLTKVNFIEGTLYDAFGQVVKKLKKSDIEDVSNVDNGQLFEDSRAKIAQFIYVQYPYTVEFEYELADHNMLSYPQWYPQYDDEMSIEKSTLTINMPAGLDLRYKEINLSKGVNIISNPTGKQYVWQVTNLPTFKWEDYAPYGYPQQVASVYTTPTEFEVEGYKGSMRTWEELSKFFYDLNVGRDELPESIKLKANQLVANEKNSIQKIKRLYEYMQTTTRYVGVQLGIGGWQTIPASIVAEKGYGDCKALSNYMKALLKAVGITSYCASVWAGDNQESILPDFPNPYFNHVILCIPQTKDTVWLECTSQTDAFAYQGSFTGNRYALIEAPSGGKLLKTTHYTAYDNLQSRTIKAQLNETGDATVDVITHYHGQQQDKLNQYIQNVDHEEQKKVLYKQISIPSFDINKFSFQIHKQRIPFITENLSLLVRKCGSKSGTRMFITPNLMNASTHFPQKSENRKSDFVLPTSYMDIDTVIYQLPKGYGIEFVPEAVKIESKFGTYQSSLQTKEDQITYIRTITVNRGNYPAGAYNEWVDFRKKIVKADKTQLVLVNKGL